MLINKQKQTVPPSLQVYRQALADSTGLERQHLIIMTWTSVFEFQHKLIGI